MYKKLMVIVLALSMLLCLAACGDKTSSAETSGNKSDTDESAPADDKESSETEKTTSDEEKNLSERIAETNPANQYEELTAAYEICNEQLSKAIASVEQAGLSEDSTLSGLITEWGQTLGDLHNYLNGYAQATPEELAALEGDADFMYYINYFLPDLAKVYNMTGAIAEDPALWLERYTLVPQSQTEEVEFDGSWPEGYFFSDRVPKLENVDTLMVSEGGKEYGFEDGVEYSLLVNSIEKDQAMAYIDQLVEAGFREETVTESIGVLLWFGRLNDSEGHISAAIMYNGNVSGTAENPALIVQYYNYDIVGIMLDIGQIY